MHFNLMGLLIGNGCTKREECTTSTYYSRYTTEFFYTRGFLEEAQYTDYKNKCLINEDSESSTLCISAQKNIYNNFISTGANIYNIYAKCYTPVYPPNYQQTKAVYE